MEHFTDTANRKWCIDINAHTLRLVEGELDIKMLDWFAEDQEFQKVVSDPLKMIDVIWVLISEQAGRANVTEVDFAKSMSGDPVDAATQAVLTDLINFYPKGKREMMRTSWDRLQTAEAKTVALIKEKMDGPELDRAIDQRLQTLNESFGNVVESLASETPVAPRSGSYGPPPRPG